MSDNDHSPDEVSGQTAFWILASLAAAAVVLPSTSSRNNGRNLFGGNIDLARCIPGVCLVDGIMDSIYLCVCACRALTSPQPAKSRRRATVVAAKLIIAIFTVFPQIIKAFSLKGVPATQFCAFLFFFAFVTRLLIDLCGLDWEEPYTPPENEDTFDVLVLLCAFFQSPFEFWIWYNINSSVSNYKMSDGFSHFVTITSLFCFALIMLQGLIWLAFVITRRRFDISATPHTVPIRFLLFTVMALSVTERRERPKISETESGVPPPPDFMTNFRRAETLMMVAILSSITLAKVLDVVSKLVSMVRAIDASAQTEVRSSDGGEQTKEDGTEPEESPPVPKDSFLLRWAHAVDRWSVQSLAMHSTDRESSSVPKGSFLGRLGVVVDRWAVQCITLHSTASYSITLTVFNLITTVIYYLVYFDGTGTVNPGWTSVLG
ncbi:hypothetical protein LB507_009029 [Fusarium sp. FIESC RH6]|nr:hypothetical protein LB507_009029 [Fusarium sp. FIESC RH6]